MHTPKIARRQHPSLAIVPENAPLPPTRRSVNIAPDFGGSNMRKFLVVLDDSRECLNAMRFAAMRAAHTGGGVAILSIIPHQVGPVTRKVRELYWDWAASLAGR